MNLRSLQQYDDITAAGILAGIALGSTANPGVGTAADFASDFGDREQEVLTEIRQRLKLPDQDQSSDANSKVLEVVSQAISESILRGKDRSEIVARAGNRGLLPPSMYHIAMGQAFSLNFKQFAAREAHARDTILHADDYQHLITTNVSKDTDKFSLFLKWHPGSAREDGFWALAFTYRDGPKLEVQHLWRVYPSEVDVSKAQTPVDLLAAFCQKFGLDVTVMDRKTAKFIAQERFPAKYGHAAEVEWKVVQHFIPHITTASIRKFPEDQHVDVGIVYAIDVEKYKTILRRHGVMVR